MRSVITGSGIGIPDNIVTNDDLARIMETSDEWIRTRSGIEERRFASSGQGSADLGATAAKAAIENAGLEPDAIDAVVFATMTPDFYFPGNGPLLQDRAFVLGYRPPATPDVYFLWQVGVAPESRGQGLAGRSVIALLRRLEVEGVRFLEATVTPSNEASAALFRGVARRLEAPCEERPLFGRELFPAGDGHEEEILFRIGPWPPSPTPENRSEDRTR